MPHPKTSLEQKQRWMRERRAPLQGAVDLTDTLDFRQHHYTVAEVAKMWNLGLDAVRRLFEAEPGVLVLGGNGGRVNRRYTTLRIPQSVVERVYRRQLSG